MPIKPSFIPEGFYGLIVLYTYIPIYPMQDDVHMNDARQFFLLLSALLVCAALLILLVEAEMDRHHNNNKQPRGGTPRGGTPRHNDQQKTNKGE